MYPKNVELQQYEELILIKSQKDIEIMIYGIQEKPLGKVSYYLSQVLTVNLDRNIF